MGIVVRVVRTGHPEANPGSGGMNCQLPGCAATVSAVASASGGIKPGAIIDTGLG